MLRCVSAPAARAASASVKYRLTPPPMRKLEAGGERVLNRAVRRLVAPRRPGLQLVLQPVRCLAAAANEAKHVIGELVHIADVAEPLTKERVSSMQCRRPTRRCHRSGRAADRGPPVARAAALPRRRRGRTGRQGR